MCGSETPPRLDSNFLSTGWGHCRADTTMIARQLLLYPADSHMLEAATCAATIRVPNYSTCEVFTQQMLRTLDRQFASHLDRL